MRHVLVAGHGAYLTDDEAARAVAPRLRAAVDVPAPWVGTEGIERLALAVGGTQYDFSRGRPPAMFGRSGRRASTGRLPCTPRWCSRTARTRCWTPSATTRPGAARFGTHCPTARRRTAERRVGLETYSTGYPRLRARRLRRDSRRANQATPRHRCRHDCRLPGAWTRPLPLVNARRRRWRWGRWPVDRASTVRRGASVTVFERDTLGSGASGRAAGL